MKDVTAAVIIKDGKVFLARRAPGENGWEFPGGKCSMVEYFSATELLYTLYLL